MDRNCEIITPGETRVLMDNGNFQKLLNQIREMDLDSLSPEEKSLLFSELQSKLGLGKSTNMCNGTQMVGSSVQVNFGDRAAETFRFLLEFIGKEEAVELVKEIVRQRL